MIKYVQFNTNLYYARGSVVKVECDKSGIVLNKKLRKLIKDSEIDRKITILETK